MSEGGLSASLASPLARQQPATIAPILDARAVRTIASRAIEQSGGSHASGILRAELQAIDASSGFTAEGFRLFQQLLAQLAVPTQQPVLLPLDDRPFWHRASRPLAGYRSTPDLPPKADVVVIGAGLTGASAAYHLRAAGLAVVVLDQGDPAGEASGRNGGNFELIPENSVGVYEGLARGRRLYMARRFPRLAPQVLHAVSERQASLVLGLALRNRDALRRIIMTEGIACDFSPRGWLHIAANETEEQGICEEVSLAAQHGQRIEIWSRGKIHQEFGFRTDFLGRFIPGDGTYHPLKYVYGLLQSALESGAQLYTRVKVRRIVNVGKAGERVVTDDGIILARRVIVATNAFTRELFPELSAIQPYQSQVLVTEHVPDCVRGRIVTSDNGPVFFNQPRQGAREGYAALLIGGGDDRPMKNPYSRRRSPAIHAKLIQLRDSFYPELAGQPPSTEWVGPMAFTPDGLPCIGFLRQGIIVAAGYNGYGGSYTTAAGEAAAHMAISGEVPEWAPSDIFSPRRLLIDEPLFLSERAGLWQVASSLCRQLLAVNSRIAETVTLDSRAEEGQGSEAFRSPQVSSRSAQNVTPEALRAFPLFANFTIPELRRLLGRMRCWDLPDGAVVCAEGSAGGSCFIILDGTVDVSIRVGRGQQLLATLAAGSIFGQVSLIENAPRSATCSARGATVLLELERDACEGLLRGQSAMGLKLLGTLNDGLISALRGADQRLMQLDRLGTQSRPVIASGAAVEPAIPSR